MFVFLAITVQMGQCLWDQPTNYWATMDQFYMPVYSNMWTWDILIHPLVLTLHTQQEYSWQDRQKFWQSMYNQNLF
jgi:hypothetical protein